MAAPCPWDHVYDGAQWTTVTKLHVDTWLPARDGIGKMKDNLAHRKVVVADCVHKTMPDPCAESSTGLDQGNDGGADEAAGMKYDAQTTPPSDPNVSVAALRASRWCGPRPFQAFVPRGVGGADRLG